MRDRAQARKWDVIIIGGGPAGITSAIYCARACLSVLLIEKYEIGGKLKKTLFIDNYPGFTERSGFTLSEKMSLQLQKLGIEIFIGEVKALEGGGDDWLVKLEKAEFISKTVLITTGMRERLLEIENEREYYGKGVSYCAICEGNLYSGEDVIVIGGGNSALEESIYLSEIVHTLKLVHRRNEFRGDEILLRELKGKSNVQIFTPFKPIRIVVEDDKVVGLEVENLQTYEKMIISAKAVFIFIGLLPESNFLDGIGLHRDERGFIYVNSEMGTNLKGIYAAGDVIVKNLRQIVTAMNDGAIAAISIKNYLKLLE